MSLVFHGIPSLNEYKKPGDLPWTSNNFLGFDRTP
jgi:hypothetical protein